MEKAVANLGKRFTVRLDGKGDFKSIQGAINAAPANSLIEIQDNGPYNERIGIGTEGLTIRGKKSCWPVITSVGPLTGFPVLVSVSAPRIQLERLLLLHGGAAGLDQMGLVGNVSIRSSIGWGAGLWELSGGTIEDCVTFCGVKGANRIKNCLCFGGFDPYPFTGYKVENAFLRTVNRQLASGEDLRCCTIEVPLVIVGPNVKLFDCIVPFVQSDRTDPVIDHCNVHGNPPFVGSVKPGKGCFGGDPQWVDPANFDYRLRPTSPCRGKASDGSDVGCRYTPQMIEMLKLAFDLRRRGILKF